MAVLEIKCDESWHQITRTGGKMAWSPINVGVAYLYIVYRGSMKFPLTNLPSGSKITKVELIVNNKVAGNSSGLWDIQPYNNDGQAYPCDDDGATFWDRCNPATVYVNDTIEFRTIGLKTFVLGSQACIDLENAKSVDRFSLGFHEEGDNHSMCQLDGKSGTVAKLRITYTPPSYQYMDGLVCVQY